MKVINIQAAKTHLSRIVEEAAAGEDIVLAKAGKPMVRIVPYVPVQVARKGGQLKGKITEAADAWTPDDGLAKKMTSPSIYPVLPDDERSPMAAEDPS